MTKSKSIILVLVLLFLLTSSSFAYGQNHELDKFLGTYRGSYYANQGHTGLTLKVYLDENSNYIASFNFYSVPENPSVPSGEYICDVKYDPDTDQYAVIGKEWVNKPSGYVFVDLYGEYENLTYTGTVKASSREYTFDLIKQVEDNAPSIWAEDTVDSAVIEGIVPLELQADYKEPIIRAEFTRLMIATISKHEGKDIEEVLADKGISIDENIFNDTKDKFVIAAFKLNIVDGYGNGYFGPDDLLTREQAAKILRDMLNFFGVYNTNELGIKFKDENKFSDWAKEHIEFITACNIENLDTRIMEGVGENFDPQGNYTKEQAYLTVYRLLKYIMQ